MSHVRRRAEHGCSAAAGGGPREGLNECESEVKVVGVGAAADHPGGALEQDARRDGERESAPPTTIEEGQREGGRGKGAGGGWVTHKHAHTHTHLAKTHEPGDCE